MKVLLLFPPQWSPISPHFGIPSLIGQLKREGCDAEGIDLNIDFYNEILDESNVVNVVQSLEQMQKDTLNEISKYHDPNKQFEEYPIDIQGKLIKYSKIKEYIQQRQYQLENIPKLINEAKRILNSKEDFYKPEFFVRALSVIDTALEIVSLPYFPSKISFDSYTNSLFKLNYESIKYHCFDKNTNIFIDYFERKVEEILDKNPDYIGIAINSSSQIVPGLTLANILKQKTKAHINIGGNFFGRVADNLVQRPDFFDLFADSLLVEEGEKPVVDLAKYIDGKITIEEVSNLIYKAEDGDIKVNTKAVPLKLDEVANIDLTGFDLSKYFAPETVMPFQTSKGCYWGKCSFCDQDFGQNFNVKNVDKLLEEIAEVKAKYGISKFEFIDESVGPSYFSEMSEKMLKLELQVDYFSNARLETAFSKDILEKARKSGLRMLLWGLESGSNKIMELINKGIDIEKRFEILKNSSDSDIWNFAFIFFGFPAETIEDAKSTIEMLCRNNDIIHSYGRSVFTMGKHTKLRDNPDAYGIIGVSEQQDEFSPTYDFKAEGMTEAELRDIIKLCTTSCSESYQNPLWMYLKYREYLFLYICKKGVNWVRNYKLSI